MKTSHRSRGIRAAIVSGILGASALPIAVAQNFVNGSFESPVVGDVPGFLVYNSGTTGPTGWNRGNGDMSLTVNTRGFGKAFAGRQFLFVPESMTQASLTQTVSGLVPGVNYIFSFRAAAYNNTASDSSCYLRIGISSDPVNPFLGVFVSAPAGATTIGSATSPWGLRSRNFTATQASETFEFYAIREPPDNAYAAIDDVRMAYGFNGLPAVRIARAGKKAVTVKKAAFVISGTASSRIPIQSVTVRVGKRTFAVTGQSVWLSHVRLKPGRNHLSALAVDAAGYPSPAATLTVIRERP